MIPADILGMERVISYAYIIQCTQRVETFILAMCTGILIHVPALHVETVDLRSDRDLRQIQENITDPICELSQQPHNEKKR